MKHLGERLRTDLAAALPDHAPLLEHIEPLADDATPLWTIGSRLRSGTPSAELGKDCR